jgi:hypothetical protein
MMQTIITCTWHNRHHVMLATASVDLEALQCSRYWLLTTTIWVLSVVAELVVPGGGDHPPKDYFDPRVLNFGLLYGYSVSILARLQRAQFT